MQQNASIQKDSMLRSMQPYSTDLAHLNISMLQFLLYSKISLLLLSPWQNLGDLLATKMGFKEENVDSPEKRGANEARNEGGRGAQGVMTTVMVMSVAILCMLLAKRPILRPAF